MKQNQKLKIKTKSRPPCNIMLLILVQHYILQHILIVCNFIFSVCVFLFLISIQFINKKIVTYFCFQSGNIAAFLEN